MARLSSGARVQLSLSDLLEGLLQLLDLLLLEVDLAGLRLLLLLLLEVDLARLLLARSGQATSLAWRRELLRARRRGRGDGLLLDWLRVQEGALSGRLSGCLGRSQLGVAWVLCVPVDCHVGCVSFGWYGLRLDSDHLRHSTALKIFY